MEQIKIFNEMAMCPGTSLKSLKLLPIIGVLIGIKDLKFIAN